jgi:putative endonuclease
MAEHNQIGKLGEQISKTFLIKHGFLFIENNYRTRQGEVDIVVKKDNKIHFIEVKSVKVRSFDNITNLVVRPEDNLTKNKWSKLTICIESYLQHRNVPRETRWQVDLACVYINTETRQGMVKLLENIQIE